MAKDGKMMKATEPQGGVFLRGQREFRHDLFKSDVKPMKKNVSYQKGIVKIVDVEHRHVVHSHNSQGQKKEFTDTVGGHFHAVEFGVDANGTPTVKCGPAMREVFKKGPGGQKRKKVPCRWHDAVNERDVVDDHTHTFVYDGSEMLSERKVRAIQSSNQSAVSDALGEMRGVAEKHAEESRNDGDYQVEETGE